MRFTKGILFFAFLISFQVNSMEKALSIASNAVTAFKSVDNKLSGSIADKVISGSYRLFACGCCAGLAGALSYYIYKNSFIEIKEGLKRSRPEIQAILTYLSLIACMAKIMLKFYPGFNKTSATFQMFINSLICFKSMGLAYGSYKLQDILTHKLNNAIKCNDINKAKLSILLGADLNGFKKYYLNTSLFEATKQNNIEIVELLMSKVLKIFHTQEAIANSLYLAVDSNNLEITKALVRNGIDPKVAYKSLQLAIERNDLNINEVLLQAGADPNFTLGINRESLLFSVRSEEMAKLLLQYNVDINAQDANGITPLMALTKASKVDNECHKILKMLLNQGADRLTKDNYGKTIYDYTKRKPEVKNVMEEYQSELNRLFEATPLPSPLVDVITEYA